ncbi:MAG: hypothetical protein RIS35_3746 [Pseudomonadota bacterium]|jgi:tape measure domain-containing protein
MANQRDVKMTLSVETLGSEEIQQLQQRVLALGNEAGEAAPEFQQLAEEIGRLGQQADALRNFESLSARVDELRVAQAAAAEQSTALRANLDALAQATQEAATRQANAATAYTEAKAGLADLRGQIEILGKTYDSNGERAANFRQEMERLTREKVAQKAAVEQAKNALADETAALKAAEAAQAKLQKTYERSVRSVNDQTKALTEQEQILAASAQSVNALGLAADNLAAAQAQVIAALNGTGKAALAAQDALEAARRAQAEAAEESRLAAIQEAAQLALRKKAADERIAIEQDISAAVKREAAIRADAEKKAAQEATDATKLLEAKARDAARGLDEAFGTLGVRSVKELEAEILQVRAAMQRVQDESGQTGSALASAMSAGKARIAELERDLRGVRNELTLTDKAANLFRNSIGQIAAGNLVADAVGALVERVKELGRQFIVVNVQAETMTRGLSAVYKSSEIASQQIAFLRATAASTGLAIGEISDSFVRFNAATQSSNIPLAQSNALFKAVAQASATLGLSSQRATLAIDALGQIASKGVVSMEELRQQLGDSLPGALTLTAKGLNITDAELIKLVESGNLAARDFFPAFTKGLQTLTAETDGIQASWNRFKTTLTIVAQSIGEAGFITVLTSAIKLLGGAVGTVAIALATLAERFFLVGKAAAAAFLALGGKGTEALEFFTEEVEKSDARIQTMRDSLEALLEPTGEAAQRLIAAGNATEQAGAKATAAGVEVAALSAKYVETAAIALGYEAAQTAVSKAQQIAGDTTQNLGSRIVALGVQMGTLATAAENEVVVRGKATKAVEAQAAQIVDLAKIQGNEVELIGAQIQSNDLLRASTEAEAKAREAYAGILAAQLEATRQLALEEGTLAERAKQNLDALEQKLAKATADAQATRAQADGYTTLRLALEKSKLAFEDNAGRVEEFRAKLEQANRVVAATQTALALGAATQDDFRKAQEQAAVAAARYNDALRDQTEKVNAVTRSKIADNSIAVAALQLQLQQAKSDEERARRLGLENSLRIALIRQKEIEIAIDKLKAEAMRIEAQGSIELAKAQRAELESRGALTEAKRIELDTQIKLAEIKSKEAEIIGVTIKSREEELARIRARREDLKGEFDDTKRSTEALGENARARDDLTSSIDREAAARSRNADAAQREADASNKMTSTVRGADGRTDEQRQRLAGQTGPVDSTLPFTIQDRAARGDQFTAQDLPQIRAALAAAEQNLAISQQNSTAVSLAGMADMESRVLSLRQILDRAVGQVEQADRDAKRKTQTPAATGNAPAAPAGQIVNINIAGRTSQVRVADAASAANLESVLRQLADSAGTAR